MRPARLLAVLCLLLLAALVGPAPASAAVRDVRITQDGGTPQQRQVSAGDTLLPGDPATAGPLSWVGTDADRGAGLDRITGTAAGQPPALATAAGGEAPETVGPRPALGTPVEARRFGLPLVLATVLAGGVLSLLVRVLLAEAPGGPAEPTTA